MTLQLETESMTLQLETESMTLQLETESMTLQLETESMTLQLETESMTNIYSETPDVNKSLGWGIICLYCDGDLLWG
jgi:hypothetical protein